MRLTKSHALAVATLLATLGGCATPIGKQNLVDFLQDGKTTREEVFLHLAEPSASFEGGRVLT